MVSRIITAAIVCFWIVMTTLLIHLETYPDQSDLLTLPASHVFRLMFLHQQISDLTISQNGHTLGNLMLHPESDASLDERSLVFSGGISVQPPGADKKQRLTWDGTLVMDHAFKTRSLVLTASLQDPPYHIHLDIEPLNNRADYDLALAARPVKHASIPLTQDGINSLLRNEFGLDPALLQNIPMKVGAPTLTAKQTELKIRNENVVAYLLTFKQGETTLAEIYVSQLGQVLTAKTLLGYNFSTEDLSPP